MRIYKNKRSWIYINIILVWGVIFLTGCNNDDDSNVLLQATLQLAPGQCSNVAFTGQTGQAVNITATGPSNEDPNLFVNDPTNTEVARAEATTLGSETLGFTPAVTGTFTVNVCDANNVGGPVRVVVTD